MLISCFLTKMKQEYQFLYLGVPIIITIVYRLITNATAPIIFSSYDCLVSKSKRSYRAMMLPCFETQSSTLEYTVFIKAFFFSLSLTYSNLGSSFSLVL